MHRPLITVVSSVAILAISIGNIGAGRAEEPKEQSEPAIPENKLSRSMLSGNDSRLAAMHSVNMDCSSGPVPVIRVVKAPENGEIRLEQIKFAIDRKKDDAYFHCNGKPVDAIAVFYKPKPDFLGLDKAVLDVDFIHTNARRYSVEISVR